MQLPQSAAEWERTAYAVGEYASKNAIEKLVLFKGIQGAGKIIDSLSYQVQNIGTIAQATKNFTAQQFKHLALVMHFEKSFAHIPLYATLQRPRVELVRRVAGAAIQPHALLKPFAAVEYAVPTTTRSFAAAMQTVSSLFPGADLKSVGVVAQAMRELGISLGSSLVQAKPGFVQLPGSSTETSSLTETGPCSSSSSEQAEYLPATRVVSQADRRAFLSEIKDPVLRAKVKQYLHEYDEKQKIVCAQHGKHTVGGRHAFIDHQEGWHETVPGDLQHEILAKPFDYTIQTHVHQNLPESMNMVQKPIIINYEHITTPELKIRCAKGEVSGAGFHCDHAGKIQKSGFVEIRNKVMIREGCYEFEWRSHNSDWKRSTMFPEHWTKAQTIEKILDSMKNTQEIIYLNGQRYLHLGLTSEGIPISAIIEHGEHSAKLISAYPDFILYNSSLKGKI